MPVARVVRPTEPPVARTTRVTGIALSAWNGDATRARFFCMPVYGRALRERARATHVRADEQGVNAHHPGRDGPRRALAAGACRVYVSSGERKAACGGDRDTESSNPTAFVKDSAITTRVKAKLAAKHITRLAKILVDTDADGVAWLSGHANIESAVRKSGARAGEIEGVRSVQKHILVRKEG